MANLTGVTKYFATPSETYVNNLSASIASLATTVPVNANNDYADGDIAVITVEPGTTNEATFIGEKASTPARFINCKWTEGNTGVGHASGATVIDYVAATHLAAMTKGIKQHANDDGSLKATAVQAALNLLTTPSVGWNVMAQALTYTGNNSMGEFTGNFTGDVTSILSKGMKISVPRTGTVPTQAMSFVGASAQTAAKTTPSGITFTGAFTLETWIYLNSHGLSGQSQHVISRRNASDGFNMEIQPSGQLTVYYGSAGASRSITTYEMIPLKRWTHVATAVTSVATATANFYINGRLVTVSGTSGAATALTQGGDMRLGGYNTGGYYVDGYMAETRIWSVAQTQAQILANMNIPLTGAEGNLVGLWQGNGNFNDKTANANHLTASGGASATQLMSALDNQYANATEYFYVTGIGTFSGGLTPVTLFGGYAGHLPNAAVGTVQYSNVANPFGFPSSRNNWTINVPLAIQYASSSTAWVQSTGKQFQVPTGEWKVGYTTELLANSGGVSHTDASRCTLSRTTNSEDDKLLSCYTQWYATGIQGSTVSRWQPKVHSAMTTYYLLARVDTAALQVLLGVDRDLLWAELAYL